MSVGSEKEHSGHNTLCPNKQSQSTKFFTFCLGSATEAEIFSQWFSKWYTDTPSLHTFRKSGRSNLFA